MTPRYAFLLLGLAAGLAGCDGEAADPSGPPDGRPVRVVEVQSGRVTEVRHFPGTIQATQASRISFQVPGRLSRIPVTEGEMVAKGELIAALDPRDYELALRQARVEADRLRKELDRKRSLRQDGHVAQATLDNAQAAYDQAEVAVEQAEKNLADATIVAPFRAVVAERLVDRFVNVQAGTPIALLQDVASFDVEVDVPERLIVLNRSSSVVEITASLYAAPDRAFPLTIKEIATEPNPRTRTYKVTLSMEKPEGLHILPGMSATVTARFMEGDGRQVSVPSSAVEAGPDGAFRVWIYDDAEGRVHPKPVEVAALREGRAVIAEGLSGGETIVTAGVGFLADGLRVRPVAAPSR